MRVRLRILVSLFVALLVTPAVLIGAAGPSAASPPARVQGTLPCFTDTSGRDTITFVSPLTGVVVFDTTAPFDMTNVTGGIAHERVAGDRYAATVAGTTHTIDITGPASTACSRALRGRRDTGERRPERARVAGWCDGHGPGQHARRDQSRR